MSAHALRIVHAPPPRPGQHCFPFLWVSVAVHIGAAPLPRKPTTAPRRCRAHHHANQQSELSELPESWWRNRWTRRRVRALKQFLPRGGLPGDGPRSLGTHPITRVERTEMRLDVAALKRSGAYRRRPKTFGECKPGPCPWVSCRHHLKLDVDPVTHAVKDNFPGVDVDEMRETCSLRVADIPMPDDELMPLERVGAYANVTMERVRQIEKEGLRILRRVVRREQERDE